METGLSQGLYIVATPIGNLGDISHRGIDVLGKVDIILCEDTRTSGKLLAAFSIEAKKMSYHEHNAERMIPRVLDMLRQGKSVALISDAGMPLISDPGYRLVAACAAENLPVTCAPGASASLTALALSGVPTNRFFFAGFLPPKSGARKTMLQEFHAIPSTLIFYETAPRLLASLEDMRAVLGDRPAAVARELTKRFEEVKRGSLSDLVELYTENGAPKGEIVIVVGAPLDEGSQFDLDALLKDAVKSGMSLRDAAAYVSGKTGLKKKEVYARALEIKNDEL